jgi:hypothetical protein
MSNYENGNFETKYGVITVRNPGRKEAPPNLRTLKRQDLKVYTKRAGDVVLQGPALRAFKAAEVRTTPKRLRKKGKTRPIILTGVGFRSYATQEALYYSPENVNGTRFANPDGSLHCEALAADTHNGLSLVRKARVRKALIAVGWFFPISGEPWHASFNRRG